MKKLIPIAFLAITALLSNCTLKEVINPDGSIKNGTAQSSGTDTGTGTNTGTDTGTGTGTATGTTNSTSYQPLTSGSTWTYSTVSQGIANSEVTFTITGDKTTIGGKSYSDYSDSGVGFNIPSTDYFYYSNNLYINRHDSYFSTGLDDEPYLNDNVAVGGTWTTTAVSPGPDMTAKWIGTLKEKNITKTVNGKAFTEVYHTQLDLSYTTAYGTLIVGTYQYYIAKGVGIIEIDAAMTGVSTPIVKQTITSYTVK